MPLTAIAIAIISSPAVAAGILVLAVLLAIAALAVTVLKDARGSALALLAVLFLLAIMWLLPGAAGAPWVTAVLLVAAAALGGFMLPFSSRLRLPTESSRFPGRFFGPGLVGATGIVALLLGAGLGGLWPDQPASRTMSFLAVLSQDALVASAVAALLVLAALLAGWSIMSVGISPARVTTDAGSHPSQAPGRHAPKRPGGGRDQRPSRGRKRNR